MYPQYGEPRYPPGHDYSQGQHHTPLDSTGPMSSYQYPGYYGPNASEGSPYGEVPGSANAHNMVGAYGTKPGNSGSRDNLYVQGWPSMGYIGQPNSKSSMSTHYPMQVCVYLVF